MLERKLTGEISGEMISIEGPYPYSKDLGLKDPTYKDACGNWYTGTHAASGQSRYIKLTPYTDEQAARLHYLNPSTRR